MNELLELAALVESAEGADRALDLAIAEALNLPRQRNGSINISSAVTASLDAAKTLRLSGWDYSIIDMGDDGCSAAVWQHGYHDDTVIRVFASSVECALTAAWLRARAAS